MNDHKSNLDCLSSLPSELLDDIFHYAHDSSQPLTTPLSQTLLPFQRRQLFRSIKVTSYKSLENLCNNAQRKSNIPSCIRHFEFNIKFEESDSAVSEVEDPGSPSITSIEGFIRQLSSVQTLTIKGSTRMALLVLGGPVAADPLPMLRALEIASTLHCVPDPFDPINYARLQSFTRLDTLNLNIIRDSTEITSSNSYSQLSSKPFASNITQLHLIGPLTARLISTRRLLSLITPLSYLTLCDTTETSSLFHDLLDAVPTPEKLSILALGCLSEQDHIVQGTFLEHVKAFTSLKGLCFMSDFTSLAPNLYSDVRSLPIAVLGFHATAKVSLSQLTTLISGPTKHSTLGGVVFSQVDGKVGTKIEEVGKPFWDVAAQEWSVYSDWILPKWTDEFSEQGFVEFSEVAKKEGIRVEGTTVRAIGIVSQYEKERELLEEYESDDEDEEEESE